MGVTAITKEARTGRDDEVASQSFPNEVTFVVTGPHVFAGAGDSVFFRCLVELNAASVFYRTNVGPFGELTERLRLRKTIRSQLADEHECKTIACECQPDNSKSRSLFGHNHTKLQPW